MTGIPNRRRSHDIAFDCKLVRVWPKQKSMCCAIPDINNFKLLNDARGYKAGAHALIDLVDATKEMTRSHDVVVRSDGEEFVFILPGASIDKVLMVKPGAQHPLAKRYFLHESTRRLLTLRVGIADIIPLIPWKT